MARRAGSIRWNVRAFEEIRRLPEVESALRDEVARVLADAGGEESGYEGGVESGSTRSRGYVVTTSGEAIRREAEEHTLLRALGGGGSA